MGHECAFLSCRFFVRWCEGRCPQISRAVDLIEDIKSFSEYLKQFYGFIFK